MLDLPDQPQLDKGRLVGRCVRLPLQIDAAGLGEEIARLPESFWGSRAGRIGVHTQAEAIFLRGHAPAEGNLPIDERPALAWLPRVRRLITEDIGAEPMRCLLARLPPGGVVPAHVDRAKYFAQTLRLHFPIESNPGVAMYCGGLHYRMVVGEVWSLNNSTVHGVVNGDPERSRTHLICDFLPSAVLLALIGRGDADLGVADPSLEETLLGRSAREA